MALFHTSRGNSPGRYWDRKASLNAYCKRRRRNAAAAAAEDAGRCPLNTLQLAKCGKSRGLPPLNVRDFRRRRDYNDEIAGQFDDGAQIIKSSGLLPAAWETQNLLQRSHVRSVDVSRLGRCGDKFLGGFGLNYYTMW